VLLDKPEITLVLDEVQANPGAMIEVRFHPGVDYMVEEDIVMLEGEEGKMAIIPIIDQEYHIKPGRHASQFVNATNDFFWVDYIDAEVKAKDEKTIIATLVLPVSDVEEAQKIAGSRKLTTDSSGNLSVSFSSGGKEFVFDFTNSDEGLMLKK
ncbi:MAG: hypothetical protein KAI95_03905, partial [Bacteroidales bacterium]|nr:hypothetical protein [Bacteroidales bacterium]